MIKWHLEQRKISELKNWEKNPRTISEKAFKELEKSVDALGNFEPLVINIDGTVIAGNQRLRLEMKKGNNEVDVYVPERELSEEEIKKIGVISNRHSGDWDMDILANEFDDVLKDLGFDDLLPELVMEVSEDDYEEPEQLPSKVQLGEVWQLGKHRLMCGDSTKIEDVERLMNGQKADMLLTDPPYGVDYSHKNEMLNRLDGGNRIQKEIGNDNIKDYRQFFYDFISIIPFADYNTIYIFMSSKELHNLRLAIQDAVCVWGDYLVWVKNNHVLGRKDYNSKHEFILYGWKDKHKFYSGHRTTILEYGKPSSSRLHPTMKPIELLSQLIQDGSEKEMLILDVFGGSGSTLIACEQTDRICYMMELDTHYCDVIIDRWEKLTGQVATKL